jgi:hypothetical protein
MGFAGQEYPRNCVETSGGSCAACVLEAGSRAQRGWVLVRLAAVDVYGTGVGPSKAAPACVLLKQRT